MTERLKKMVDGVIIEMTEQEEAEFLASLPTPVEPPPPDITPRQLRLWLLDQGVPLASVDSAIEALPISAEEKEKAKVEWEYGVIYKFDNPLVTVLGGALGFNNEQMKQGFKDAALL